MRKRSYTTETPKKKRLLDKFTIKMFCAGIFACKPNSDDFFICSDGVEMNQNELLNIVQGVLSLLNQNPLEPGSRKVLFVEAANTYIRHYRGYIFGASTYHNLSVPLLTSTLERVFNCVNSIFSGSGEIDLQDYSNRATLFHCIRQLLSNTPGAPIQQQQMRSFNNVKDMAMNTGVSYQMEPMASGDFQTAAASAEEHSRGNEESTTENSVNDTSNQSSEISFPTTESISVSEEPQTSSKNGSVAVKLTQNASFAVRDGIMSNIECDNTLKISAVGGPESGPLLFAVIPTTLVNEQRVNTKVLEEDPNGIYKCEKPLEMLSELTKVLLFNSPIPQEAPPFRVRRSFITSGNNCKISVNITSPCLMEGILIGFDASGFENARSDDSEISFGGPNVLLSPQGIGAQGGEITASVIGNVAENYQPPPIVQIRCTLRGLSLGNISVRTHPEYNFTVRVTHQKLFVSRSAWELPVQ
ncbi:hypothetical protein TRFO_07068 [Tritrichomonas foetus]|uniref:Uncharacterized protein n=1 Tax=Tritrichomonas foetus TaxID=1144522 RepID=A0A1J4JYM5_9EUKA|nr:hypothetical protein TRFO_07068 [Tritrichomonas foetus]|eukprot:OHT02636.1 hypothetical protein TRFO_07068 [Tritrichomonas foetus]